MQIGAENFPWGLLIMLLYVTKTTINGGGVAVAATVQTCCRGIHLRFRRLKSGLLLLVL